MSDRMNRQWRLKTRPVGMVKESDFEYVEEPAASPGEGQALVRNFMVAFEPAMRGWLEDVESYVPPVGIGEVMRDLGYERRRLRQSGKRRYEWFSKHSVVLGIAASENNNDW